MNPKFLASLASSATAAGMLLGFGGPVQAASFGTSGIQFNQDTEVNFTFLKSQGAAISSLGIYDASGTLLQTLFSEVGAADPGYESADQGWLGTASNLAGAPTASYTFLANTLYTLGLSGTLFGSPMTTVFSTSGLNPGGDQQAVFGSIGGSEGNAYGAAGTQTSANPFAPVAISFEDFSYGGDKDFNDFTFSAEVVPEPLTIAGMALGGAGLAIARRRRRTA